MKKFALMFVCACLMTLGVSSASAQNAQKKQNTAPKTVIHVVTVSWKEGATPAQIQGALDAVKKLPEQYQGISRVWTRTIKAQGDRSHAIVMEFRNEQALKDYTDSDAQKEWYKAYIPVRERSTTFDITN